MGNWRFGAFPKLPYSTMQQLNLDWILDRIRRFLPDTGTKGQVLTRTKDGAAWVDPEAASGAVSSVNGKTGAVVLTASDVGALPESYVPPAAPVQSVNGQTGDVQLAIPDSTSDLTNDSGFITAAQATAAAPVQSVNGQTGAVSIFQSNNIGNKINIPVGTIYTCPSDGYAFVFCAYNANAMTRADICDQNGNEIIRFQLCNGPTNYAGINSVPVFVRKGMKIKGHSASNDGYIAFYPIV